jgi:hypothetical protein
LNLNYNCYRRKEGATLIQPNHSTEYKKVSIKRRMKGIRRMILKKRMKETNLTNSPANFVGEQMSVEAKIVTGNK